MESSQKVRQDIATPPHSLTPHGSSSKGQRHIRSLDQIYEETEKVDNPNFFYFFANTNPR